MSVRLRPITLAELVERFGGEVREPERPRRGSLFPAPLGVARSESPPSRPAALLGVPTGVGAGSAPPPRASVAPSAPPASTPGRGLALRADPAALLLRVRPVRAAGEGDLAPVLAGHYVEAGRAAVLRGAVLLLDGSLTKDARLALAVAWVHPYATWALAELLEHQADAAAVEPVIGEGTTLGPNVVLSPRVLIGKNVIIGANSVIGRAGFGWATGPDGVTRPVPQLGGVVIEDDAVIGPLCTVDAGTLSPTRVARGAKLDAHVHVGHNTVIGEDTVVAAQCGFAGSVKVGKGVLIGGQVGVSDHVTIGDGARIAAKSGVIGDVPAGATFGGYPAVERTRWLRALAWLHRASS